MTPKLTQAQARAFRRRWQRVNAREEEELASLATSRADDHQVGLVLLVLALRKLWQFRAAVASQSPPP